MLLCIPIPLIVRAKLPLARKLVIGVLLGVGFFLIIAVTLNNLFSLMYKYDGLYKTFHGDFLKFGMENPSFVLSWGTRETFVAVLVVNAPCIKPLFSSSVWLRVKHKTLTKISKHSMHSIRANPENGQPQDDTERLRAGDAVSIMSDYRRDASINSKRAMLSPASTREERLSPPGYDGKV
ncbi:hypothetical protein ABW19_dt0208738 [Dactylella cylindrospora]|nr:hypothetical protein ABW19_dt0208738 [Dactylella cylindrospora]